MKPYLWLRWVAILSIVMVWCISSGYAQRVVRGQVTEAFGAEPLAGVLVTVKGKDKSVLTGPDGKYSIEMERRENILVFSLPGFRSKEAEASFRTIVNVQLEEDLAGLQTEYATAFGFRRKKHTLGYAAQHLNARELDKARDLNFTGALTAKIAGLNVTNTPSGLGNSTLSTLRGQRSLQIMDNQPLFVVDGVPVSNRAFASVGRGYQDVDYTNAAGFLNPDDMESVTVLKGANAAALYGARGSNGVIAITTRTGKNTRGIGVSFNSTLQFDDVLRLPDYQNQYGQGLEGQFNFIDGIGGGLNDGVAESWGPAFAGQRLRQFDAPTTNDRRGGDVGNVFQAIGPVQLAQQLANRGEVDSTLWQAQPRNVRDFFRTGATQVHHLGVSGGNERGDFRLAYTFTNQRGTLPNTGLQRNGLALTGGYELSAKIKARATFHYLRAESYNRPALGEGTENVMALFNSGLPRSVNVASLRDNIWQVGRFGQNQFNFNYTEFDNPYFILIANENSQRYDRLYGNTSLDWQLKPWLNLLLRLGTDVSNEFRARQRAFSSQAFLRGSYREEEIAFEELNTDMLLRTGKDFSPDFGLFAGIGAGNMHQNLRITELTAPELTLADVFTLSNSRLPLASYSFRSEKRIQGAYAFTNLRYQQFLYLDLNTRHDWLSALPRNQRSILSYSGSLSAVLSEAFGWNDPDGVVSLLQARLSYARTGSDPDPYQLQTIFMAQTPVRGIPTSSESPNLAKADLRPELTTSIEAGLDVRFFNNRLALDATVFQSRTDDQILSVPLSLSTGYATRIVNAGSVENRGLEAVISVIPVETDKFRWQIGANWAAWRGKVLPGQDSLTTSYLLADRYVTVEARPGERVGNFYGTGYQRVSNDSDSPFYDASGAFIGQIVHDASGKPIPTAAPVLLGNYNPDWVAGIHNTFTFKGFNLYCLFDMRVGGVLYARSKALGLASGLLAETLRGRADGYNLALEGNGIIGNGAALADDGTFVQNTTKVSAREWYSSYTVSRPIDEAMLSDASFIKLRELRLSFHLPSVWLGKSRIRNAMVSVVGRNLFILSDFATHIDPETATFSGGVITPGIESFAIPSVRSIGFNLSFKF
ncbi:MAG TPA: SusC/RagA family TonB-linked outer membrane protein [Saprospiraceae bacterium]|nr:SusC/RagA family TonB-linked outer membrane protein [Saprospiraceae bacterium]HMP22504.1 SusC/RagA family TonB-linked outer membrane protein [Saprospiraceae bacterium]